MPKQYFVCLLSNRSRMLYAGVTNDLIRRVFEHKSKPVEGFSKRYNLNKLVYYETTPNVRAAVSREKQIKGWSRKRKTDLINSMTPGWKDLSLSFFNPPRQLEAKTIRYRARLGLEVPRSARDDSRTVVSQELP